MASAPPSIAAPRSQPQLGIPHTTFDAYTAGMAATFGAQWPLRIRPLLAPDLQRLAAQLTSATPPAPELQHVFSHLAAPLSWNSWQQLLSRLHLSPTTYAAYTAAMSQDFGPGWRQRAVHVTAAETALCQRQHSAQSNHPLPPEIHPLLTQLPHAVTWNAWQRALSFFSLPQTTPLQHAHAMLDTFGPSWAAAATALTSPELLQLTAAWQPTPPLPTPTTGTILLLPNGAPDGVLPCMDYESM